MESKETPKEIEETKEAIKEEAPQEKAVEAPKAEIKGLRNYELVFVVSPKVKDEALEATLAKVTQLITSRGGIISQSDHWGKKRLAYPIKHFTEGDYTLSRFLLRPAMARELEANIRISEEIIRHLLVEVESKA